MKIKASNAFNAIFVNTVDTYTGVCGSYTTPYAGVKTLHIVASRPCQEGRLLYCVSLPSWGLAVYQSVSQLMRAIRCANSEHSASNAGVPTDPHSPESNSSYLA